MHGCLFIFIFFLYFGKKRRESDGRRRRFRWRERDEAGGGGVGGDDEDSNGEEGGYGACNSHAQREKVYHDLCRLHLPPPPSTAQVILIFIYL